MRLIFLSLCYCAITLPVIEHQVLLKFEQKSYLELKQPSYRNQQVQCEYFNLPVTSLNLVSTPILRPLLALLRPVFNSLANWYPQAQNTRNLRTKGGKQGCAFRCTHDFQNQSRKWLISGNYRII